MNILLPNAGHGSRFRDAKNADGTPKYTLRKPELPLTDRFTGNKIPMVIAAVKDLPGSENPANSVIFVNRPEFKGTSLEKTILQHLPQSVFLYDADPKGQAASCLVARELIDNDDELIMGACDNGMAYDRAKFEAMRQTADVIIFTFRNDERVLKSEGNPKGPDSYGWVKVAADGETVTGMSVKKAISETPMRDHAVVAAFWFKRGRDFVKATDDMMAANDKINGEFYSDQAMAWAVKMGLTVKVCEVDKYICWGMPADYEGYESTINYWMNYAKDEAARTKKTAA